MELALYQPDIAQNFGAMLRLAACFGVRLSVIEPCGFPLDDARIRRAGMDYIDQVDWQRHASWNRFLDQHQGGRLVLLTTQGGMSLYDAQFATDDVLLLGRESAGAPPAVHERADLRLRIPMRGEARSLNIALSAAIALSEALRQTGQLPEAV